MKKLFVALIAFLVASSSLAGIRESQIRSPAVDGRNVKRVARVVYDTSTVGFGSSTVNSGDHRTGVSLPAKSIITDSYLYVVTQVQSPANGTIAFKCEDAANIFAAKDITGSSAGAILSGKQSGPVATDGNAADMTASIASECRITGTVGVSDLTAGKVILFVEYVVGL